MVATKVTLPFSMNSAADSEMTSTVSRTSTTGFMVSLSALVKAMAVAEFFEKSPENRVKSASFIANFSSSDLSKLPDSVDGAKLTLGIGGIFECKASGSKSRTSFRLSELRNSV